MLKILIGRTGSGKSQKCIEEFNSYIQKNVGISCPAYFFVPEQYNMITERRLLEYQIKENFDVQGLIGHEILNFKRFVHRILSMYGSFDMKNLNETGKLMLLTAAVENVKGKLTFYKNLNKKTGEISELLKLIDEFKKYNVSFSILNDTVTDDKYLNTKLSDISLIYGEYEKLKKDSFSDNNDAFQIMLDIVKKENFFKNKSVWIDSFTGFTQKDFELISVMMMQCKNITITLCTDLSSEPAFYAVDKTFNRLKSIAENFGIECIIENLSINNSFELSKYNNKSLYHLEQNISKYYSVNKYQGSNIFLTECDDVYDEVTRCAKRIKEIHDNGIEYKNIAVALRNISGYDVVIKSVFNLYDIPFFIDDKKSIDNNPLIKTVTSVLSLIKNGWKSEDALECIKSNLLNFIENVDYLEEIILSTGLKGKKRWKQCENEQCKIFYDNLLCFEKELGKCKDLKSATICLCNFLKKHNVPYNIEKIAKNNEIINIDLKNEYYRIWNIFIEVIEQIVLFLSDVECSGAINAAEQLLRLLNAGFSQYKIGFLPSDLNSVQIMDIDRSRSAEIKALFVLGLNDGVLPARFNDDGILKDSDRAKLEIHNIILADDIETKVAKENYYIYFILSLPTDILDISWPLCDISWNSVRSSTIVIRKIQKLFHNVVIEHYEKDNFINSETMINNSSSDNIIEKDVNLDLFHINGELTTTVSRIEKYNKCPYSYFLTYGLKLKERDEYELQTYDLGNFLHEMVDNASEYLFEMNNADIEDYRKLADATFEVIAKDMRIDFDNLTPRDKHALNRIKNYTGWIFNNIKNQMDAGGMKLYGTEIEFGTDSNSKFKSIELTPDEDVDNLKKINVVGKIDRVDLLEKNGTKYVRVVDYKSSSTAGSITANDIKTGIKLQLITYLYAAIESFGSDKSKPAGVFYYVFDNDLANNDKHVDLNSEKIEPKMALLKGFALDDDEILKEMSGDKKYVMGGRANKNGDLSFAQNKNMLKSFEDFEFMRDSVYSSIKNSSVDIAKGKYPIKPFVSISDASSPCKYCNMRSVCAICHNVNEQ